MGNNDYNRFRLMIWDSAAFNWRTWIILGSPYEEESNRIAAYKEAKQEERKLHQITKIVYYNYARISFKDSKELEEAIK